MKVYRKLSRCSSKSIEHNHTSSNNLNKELWEYIAQQNKTTFEGSSTIQEETEDLIRWCKDAKSIMEIGFNAGNSAVTFLKNSSAHLTSFDIGLHETVQVGKEFIDKTYSGRHSLIIGDSTVKVPEFISNNPGKTFDLIFIDGGHDYHVALADFENCRMLSGPDTIVIMDDVWDGGPHWCKGPTRVIRENERNRTIFVIEERKYEYGRGIAVFKYI